MRIYDFGGKTRVLVEKCFLVIKCNFEFGKKMEKTWIYGFGGKKVFWL